MSEPLKTVNGGYHLCEVCRRALTGEEEASGHRRCEDCGGPPSLAEELVQLREQVAQLNAVNAQLQADLVEQTKLRDQTVFGFQPGPALPLCVCTAHIEPHVHLPEGR